MSRLVRLSLVVLSVAVGLAVVGVIGVAWKDRADDLCREDASSTTGGYTVTWEWDELAYVCAYRAPDQPPRRVGVIDAFHGRGQRHRPAP